MGDPRVTLGPAEVEVDKAILLGRGGRFAVFAGRFKGRNVALKTVAADWTGPLVRVEEDLWAEYEALKKLNHPHIVEAHGTWRSPQDHQLHLVLERLDVVEGQVQGRDTIQSLADNIRVCQQKHQYQHARDWDEATRHIFAQLFDALDHAHRPQFFHNDLKPDNIFVQFIDGELRVKLCDFDAAGAHNERGRHEYRAPERFDVQPSTAASEVYSLGVLIYHTLTGTLPYPEQDVAAARNARATPVDKLTGERQRAAWRYIRNFPEVASALPWMMALEPDKRPTLRGSLTMLGLDGVEVEQSASGLQWPYAAAAVVALLLLAALVWPLDDNRLSQAALGRQSQQSCQFNLKGHVEAFCGGPSRPADCEATIWGLSREGMCSTRYRELARCNSGP